MKKNSERVGALFFRFLKFIFSNGKLGAWIIGILTVCAFYIQPFFENYLTNKPFGDVARYLAISIGIFLSFLAGYFFSLLFWLTSSKFPSITEKMEKTYDDTLIRFQDWEKTASGVLKEAQRLVFKSMWISQPWEYITEIERADKEVSGKNAAYTHINSITLYGTMVGFAFLLPEALRNHLCRAKNQFHTLWLYASDAKLATIDGEKPLVNYPLYLTAQLVSILLECKSFLELLKSDDFQFTIKIGYFPHDLFNAVIHLSNHEIAILQALDRDGLARILNGEELQYGTRFINTPEEIGAYERFATAIANLNNTFKRKREIWTIRGCGGKDTPVIKIENPHWNYNKVKREATLILSSDKYDETNTEISLKDLNETRECLNALIYGIKFEPESGGDIRCLDGLAATMKSSHNMKCPCEEELTPSTST
ncbi:MAG: hypothetical protein NT166_08155 [Candidatus Aminicenantes bacterium]|nr:hypothetical protein [Candidatus Aminicenantes bacterium]